MLVRQPYGRGTACCVAFLLVASIYTRQSYALTAPLTAVVWLASQGRARHAAAVAGLTAAGAASILWVLNALSHGGFYFNVIVANENAYSTSDLSGYLRTIVRSMPVILVGAVWATVRARRRSLTAFWFVAPYLTGSFISALTIGKVGSDINYLLELMAGLSMATGGLLGLRPREMGVRARRGLAVALAVQSVGFVFDDLRQDWSAYRRISSDAAVLTQLIARRRARRRGSHDGGGHPAFGATAARIPGLRDDSIGARCHWNEAPFVARLRAGRYGRIFVSSIEELSGQRWTPAMLVASQERYVVTARLPDVHVVVYEPRRGY